MGRADGHPQIGRAFGAALTVLMLAAAACGGGSDSSEGAATEASNSEADAGAFPVTIEHEFGETTIEAAPEPGRFTIGEILAIDGPIVPALFEQALRHVFTATEIGLVRFVEDDAADVGQELDLAMAWDLPVVDVADVAGVGDAEAVVRAAADERMARGSTWPRVSRCSPTRCSSTATGGPGGCGAGTTSWPTRRPGPWWRSRWPRRTARWSPAGRCRRSSRERWPGWSSSTRRTPRRRVPNGTPPGGASGSPTRPSRSAWPGPTPRRRSPPAAASARSTPTSTPDLGRLDGAAGVVDDGGTGWRPAPGASVFGGGADPRMPLSRPLEINAVTVDGPEGPELHATWSWPDGVLTEAEVRRLAERWRSTLAALTTHVAGGSGR